MDKLFLTILNMSLTGAFVIAAICFARLLLKKAPKIISYCLWGVAGFRLVCPFSIESVFSLIPFKAQAIPPDIAMQTAPRIDSGVTVIDNIISGSLPAPALGASVNPLQIWTTIGAFVWLAGVAVMLIYGVGSFIILKRKMREAAHAEANIYEAANIKWPFVLGIFKPKIYLPLGLSVQERDYIILHEQTHIKRYDHIVKFAAYFILCVHWFNPLAWAAFLLMGADMEMSCDERVLKELGGEIKRDYSLSLLSLATDRRIIGGSPLAFGEGGVKERIKNVLNFRKPSRVIIVVAALAMVLSVGLAVNRATDGSTIASIIPMSMNNVAKKPHFAGTVTQVYDHAILVSVKEGEDVRRSSDLIRVSLNVKLKDSMTHFTVGDKVIVYYNGEIAESYPAQVNTVYAIVLTSPDMKVNMDDLKALSAMRTPYVGNNSAVGKIIDALPRLDRDHTQRFFSIGDDYHTGCAPFTLTVYYEPNDTETSAIRNIAVTPKNSVLLFSLIDNLEEINYAFRSTPSDGKLDKTAYISRVTHNKNDITKYLGTIGLGWEDFKNDWHGSVEKLFAARPVSAYEPRKWLDYYLNEQMPWGRSLELELPAYPDTVFRWTPYEVKAIDSHGEKILFFGMPIWNVYLADLTDDGLPEFCATVSIGSGIVDTRVTVYDYAAGKQYDLSDRMLYDYALSMEGGQLVVTQSEYNGAIRTTGNLAIVNGELTVVGIDHRRPELEPDKQRPLTLEDVRTLAKKGDRLLFEDFRQYIGVNVSSSLDYYIMVYGVEGGYRLIVHSNQSGKPDSVNLESIWASGGSGIDIRSGDIDGFLSKWPIIMRVKDGTATPSGVTLALKNVTNTEYTYGESYTVQRKTDNGWIAVKPVINNYGFNSIGYMLPAMGSKEIIIDWEWLYGKLPAGDYQIAKEALFVRSPGDYDTFTLFAAFTIAA
ncbi:M56 family metallopeptidase [Desulfotomaculum sp. 1211_IL3151]|uniref:M56 family metallopeptidase n=1 Tax=Desulfotomaculum sp. 1211_IL3151 TaxID=3084055 RepID=UPI002FD9A69B